MKVEYCPYDSGRFAIGLHSVDGGSRLEWASAAGQDVIMVRMPFGQLPDERMAELCESLAAVELIRNQYVTVCPDISVRLITAADRAREGGCLVAVRPASYAVYSCQCSGGTVQKIFAPQMNAMNRHYCHVAMETTVVVEQLMEENKLRTLIRKPSLTPTPYYMLHLPKDIVDSYHDGDMLYTVDGLEIPITREMLKQGIVYVMTYDRRPQVKSNNPGLTLK